MTRVIPGLIVAITLIFTAIAYPALPERIATHWSLSGEPDGWSSRAFGAWLMPGVMFAVWVLLRFFPRIDPRSENYPLFSRMYATLIPTLLGFFAVVQFAILGSALGWNIQMNRILPLAIGAFMLVIGNLLPRARPNWLVGIRTPWTLSSDRVWERTHRLGGALFMISGVALLLAAFAPAQVLMPAIIAAVVLSAGVPTLYSLFLWMREKKEG